MLAALGAAALVAWALAPACTDPAERDDSRPWTSDLCVVSATRENIALSWRHRGPEPDFWEARLGTGGIG